MLLLDDTIRPPPSAAARITPSVSRTTSSAVPFTSVVAQFTFPFERNGLAVLPLHQRHVHAAQRIDRVQAIEPRSRGSYPSAA